MDAYRCSLGKVTGVLNSGTRRKLVVSFTVSECVCVCFLPRRRFSYPKYPHLFWKCELLSNSGHGLYTKKEYTSLSYSVIYNHSTDFILDKITKTRGVCYRRMLTVVYRILIIRCIILSPVYDSAKKVAVVTFMYCKLRSSRTNVLNPFKNNVLWPVKWNHDARGDGVKKQICCITTDRTTSNTRSCYIMLTPVVPEGTDCVQIWAYGEVRRQTVVSVDMKRVKPTRCHTMVYWTLWFAQHVSGIIVPIIGSLRLYRWSLRVEPRLGCGRLPVWCMAVGLSVRVEGFARTFVQHPSARTLSIVASSRWWAYNARNMLSES